MEVQDAAEPGGPFIVMRIVWGGMPPEACYGPFPAKEDGSHLEVLQDFLVKWRAKNGEPSSVTLYSVFAPGEVDDLQEPSEV